jgi:hypothetical protein
MMYFDAASNEYKDLAQHPQAELVLQAIEIHNKLVTKIYTTLDDDGTVVIHNTGCPLIYTEPPFNGGMPEPERTRQCKCMPQLSDIMASLRH